MTSSAVSHHRGKPGPLFNSHCNRCGDYSLAQPSSKRIAAIEAAGRRSHSSFSKEMLQRFPLVLRSTNDVGEILEV
jgi:hypothetical protein